MRNKKFDCVEMKRQGARKVFAKVSLMTRREEIRFWKECTEALVKHASRKSGKEYRSIVKSMTRTHEATSLT